MWRKGKIKREEYVKHRIGLREYMEKKEQRTKEKRKEEEKELRNIRNEAGIWKYINRKRGKREWRENNIRKKE